MRNIQPDSRLLLIFLLWSCAWTTSCSKGPSATGEHTTLNSLTITHIPTPSESGSRVSRLGVGAGDDERIHLSWVEPIGNKQHALRLSFLDQGQWSPPKTIAQGPHWMVNWADFPSVVAGRKNTMAAHWLELNENRRGYGVKASVSSDGGESWGRSFWLHSETGSSEHGFVSMFPLNDGTFRAAWLDSRAHDATGNMQLWSVRFNKKGRLGLESLIDDRVCDCCDTSGVLIDDRPILVYRDRGAEEIRDISLTQFDGAFWSLPQPVHIDQWKVPG